MLSSFFRNNQFFLFQKPCLLLITNQTEYELAVLFSSFIPRTQKSMANQVHEILSNSTINVTICNKSYKFLVSSLLLILKLLYLLFYVIFNYNIIINSTADYQLLYHMKKRVRNQLRASSDPTLFSLDIICIEDIDSIESSPGCGQINVFFLLWLIYIVLYQVKQNFNLEKKIIRNVPEFMSKHMKTLISYVKDVLENEIDFTRHK